MTLMVSARDSGTPVDWLVRAKHNRTLKDGDKLWARVTKGEALGELRFTLPSRQGHKAREVIQQIWAQKVDVPDGAKGQVQASCIVARESEPPEGEKSIEWRLLTNLPVDSLEQAARLIDWYRARWEIEMFFHVLKNGCRVEALQLGSIEKMERARVLYMVVAWGAPVLS